MFQDSAGIAYLWLYRNGFVCGKTEPQTNPSNMSLIPFLRPAGGFGLLLVERGQAVHDVDGLHAHADDLLDQIDDVARVGRILIRVVDDAALLVRRDLVTVYQPADGGLAVHHVFIGAWRDAFDGQVLGHLQHGQVLDLLAGLGGRDLPQ